MLYTINSCLSTHRTLNIFSLDQKSIYSFFMPFSQCYLLVWIDFLHISWWSYENKNKLLNIFSFWIMVHICLTVSYKLISLENYYNAAHIVTHLHCWTCYQITCRTRQIYDKLSLKQNNEFLTLILSLITWLLILSDLILNKEVTFPLLILYRIPHIFPRWIWFMTICFSF